MKETKICTSSYVIWSEKEEEYVPFESLSEQEQQEFKETFAKDFMDTYMKGKGYKRVSA